MISVDQPPGQRSQHRSELQAAVDLREEMLEAVPMSRRRPVGPQTTMQYAVIQVGEEQLHVQCNVTTARDEEPEVQVLTIANDDDHLVQHALTAEELRQVEEQVIVDHNRYLQDAEESAYGDHIDRLIDERQSGEDL